MTVANKFTDAELEAYLDEALDAQRAAEIEDATRDDSELLNRLSHINGRRDAGIHTLGEIWRRNQVSVPSVEEMGNYLLDVLPTEQTEYIKFRLDVLKCPFTIAMLKDLESQQSEATDQSDSRRKKYFNSSAGLLRRKELDD